MYRVDLDIVLLTTAAWIKTGGATPSVFRLELADIHEPSDLSLESLVQKPVKPVCEQRFSLGTCTLTLKCPRR